MSQLWNIFNTLQIILLMPHLAVLMPANVKLVEEVVNGIVNFSPIDKVWLQEKVIAPVYNFDLEDTEFGESLEDKSLLLNVFEILAAISVLIVLICMCACCKCCVIPRCCPCGSKLLNFIRDKLMFNSILRAFMQKFLSTSLAVWVSLRSTDVKKPGGEADLIIAIVLVLAMITTIVFTRGFLLKNNRREQLRRPAFKRRFDSLYQNVDYYNLRALAYPSLFMIRRLVFAFTIVFFDSSIVL